MAVQGTHAGNHAGKCRECRQIVEGTVPLVPKGHPCKELNPHKEVRECRYMGVVGNYTGNHTGNVGNAGKCKECREHR